MNSLQSKSEKISKAIATSVDLKDACRIVHKALSEFIDTTNLFLVLYNAHDNTIRFPYFIDELSPGIPGNGYYVPMIRGALVSLVIERKTPLLMGKDDVQQFRDGIDYEPTGPLSQIWAGAPVLIDDQVVAVLTVQSYSNPNQYSEKDLEILNQAAQLLVPAIDRDVHVNLTQQGTNRFRSLIENIGDVIYSTDFHSRISYVSPAIHAISGYSPSELIGKYRCCVTDPTESLSSLLIHPDDRERLDILFREALENGNPFATEYRIICRDGKERWVFEKAQQIESLEKKVGLEGIINDIHEKKSAELLNKVLFEISNAINTSFDSDDLYRRIHESLGQVINLEHFYISLYDEIRDSLTMPFNTDSVDGISDIKNASKSASVTAEVIRTGKPVFLKKREQEDMVRNLGGKIVGTFSESFICVPLFAKNKVIGAMATQSYTDPKQYDEKDLELMLSVSGQVATAIQRKQSEEQLKQREILITTMYTISNAVHTTSSLQDLFKSIHRSLSTIIDARNFGIALYDKKTDTLNFEYWVDEMDETTTTINNASTSASVTQECIERGRVLLLDEEGQHEMVRKRGGEMIGPAAKSWLAAPLKGDEEILGAVLIQNYWEANVFKKQAVDLISLVSGQIAIAIERKRAEEKLKEVQKELIEKAHKAGMADIATDTLHNIGNVLNSMKISNEIISDTLSNSELRNLKQSAELIQKNIDNLDDFILNHPHGKKVIYYILDIVKELDREQDTTRQFNNRLAEKIALMVDVIRAQQAYAGTNFMTEKLNLHEIVEDTLTLQSELLGNYGIKVNRDFASVPKVRVQKTKLVHILINLISNSRQAMLNNTEGAKELRISIEEDNEHVFLTLQDTGCGIKEQNIEKIFTHGFTTRSKGHGFGLHSSANFMSEMDGRIWAESEGEGKGARFILQFPKE